jgi:hypothetical protein
MQIGKRKSGCILVLVLLNGYSFAAEVGLYTWPIIWKLIKLFTDFLVPQEVFGWFAVGNGDQLPKFILLACN